LEQQASPVAIKLPTLLLFQITPDRTPPMPTWRRWIIASRNRLLPHPVYWVFALRRRPSRALSSMLPLPRPNRLNRPLLHHRISLTRAIRPHRTIRTITNSTQMPMVASLPNTPPSRHRRYPSTSSRRLPSPTICGRRATGAMFRQAITGFRAHGVPHPTTALCGRLVTGASMAAAMASAVATGDRISASTVGSIMASGIPAAATTAAIGTEITSTTTARSTGSIPLELPMFITGL